MLMHTVNKRVSRNNQAETVLTVAGCQ